MRTQGTQGISCVHIEQNSLHTPGRTSKQTLNESTDIEIQSSRDGASSPDAIVALH